MKHLKLCIISPRSLPLYEEGYNRENVIGGAEVNLYQLAVCLSEMEQVEVMVLVDDFGQPATLRKGNIEVIRLGLSGSPEAGAHRGLAGRIRPLRTILQLASIDADAFLFSCSNAFLGKLVFVQKLLRGKKVFYRISSDRNLDLKDFRANNRYISYLAYKFGLRHASAIIAQTEEQKACLKERLGMESSVIRNGFFPQSGMDPGKKRTILWVGRCMESKRPLLFVQLAEALPEEELVMIMPTNKEVSREEAGKHGELEREVRSAAGRLPNLRIIDYVPYERIQTWFNEAKAYVCTSVLEGFPNTFIQACLGGTPIVTYHIDPDRIVQKYGLGQFSDGDEKRAVSFLMGLTPDLQLEYWNRTMSYAISNHNIQDTAKQYLELMGKDFAAISAGGGRYHA